MAFSDFLTAGGNFLTQLADSPMAAPLALGLGSLLLKNHRNPVLARSFAQQAVQEALRPHQEQQAMNELLLTHPELTTLSAPPGVTGPTLNMGGRNIRRLGTLAQEYPSDYGQGVTGTQMNVNPAGYTQATTPPGIGEQIMGGVVPAPPPMPTAFSRFSPQEQAWRVAVGGLPATPEGQTTATKYGIDLALQAERNKRLQAGPPGMGTGGLGTAPSGMDVGWNFDEKSGQWVPTYKTPRPIKPPPLYPIIGPDRKTYWGSEGSTGTLTPTEAEVGAKPGTAGMGNVRFPPLGGGPLLVHRDPGPMPAGYTAPKVGDSDWLITPGPKPGVSPMSENPVELPQASKWQLDHVYGLRTERQKQKAAYEGIKNDYVLAQTQGVLAKSRAEILANPASQIELMDAFIRASQGFDPNLGKRMNLGQVTMLQNAQPGLSALQLWLSGKGWLSGGRLTSAGVDNILTAFGNLDRAAGERLKTIDQEYLGYGRGLNLTDKAVRQAIFGQLPGEPAAAGGIMRDLSPQEMDKFNKIQ